MASNSFGSIFRITTWGESHGKAIGVVIDGCPAGIPLNDEDINLEMIRRKPGVTPYTSPRKEPDIAEILSGVFEGVTTGAPISIIIYNRDADSTQYESTKELLRPGHANYTYLAKYGVFDHRGGGRASGRETACRVAAGAVAKKILANENIQITAAFEGDLDVVAKVQADGDSIGGVVSFSIRGVPVGLGDPVYEKIEANLAKAMLSIPATKGFEIGKGFESTTMLGSIHNDKFTSSDNNAGGTLGGITNGLPIYGRVAFKPPSSIKKPQETLTTKGERAILELPPGSRHDPCVAIRAVPVVEAMATLVVVDALLMNRCLLYDQRTLQTSP